MNIFGQRLRIVTIGGGSGQFALLSGLRRIEDIDISAVVSMMDSGGSTGRLRDELGILPPGDVLKCVLALSPQQDSARNLLLKRFQKDRRLAGHNAGNMLLTMLTQYTGSFSSGIQALSEILDVQGRILPVTMDQATLVAELTDGTRIFGERAIDVPRGDQREKIKDVFLVPHHCDAIHVYPPVIDAIAAADFIVVGPGDLFTSVIPNLVVPDVAEAIKASPAKLIYIVNIMTKFGETHNFKGIDFVQRLEVFTRRPVDAIVYNSTCPPREMQDLYASQKSECVQVDPSDPWWGRRAIHTADLLDTSGNVVRHDSLKLARLLSSLFQAATCANAH